MSNPEWNPTEGRFGLFTKGETEISVENLKQMFPDLPDEVIAQVLENYKVAPIQAFVERFVLEDLGKLREDLLI